MKRPIQWRLSDLANVKKNGLKVFSTFACGGGSTMGYKLAGFDVIGANDIDEEMQRHYVDNHKPKLFYRCPVKDLIIADIDSSLFDVDILDGSPPCSAFSMAGNRGDDWGKLKHFREGQSKQVLDDLFFDFIAFADRIKPKVIVAENVKGMLVGDAKGYCRMVIKKMEDIGYDVQLFLVNAADCGVPQTRERVFFVAKRKDIAGGKLTFAPAEKWISLKDAFVDVENTEEQLKEVNAESSSVVERIYDKTKPGTSFAIAAKKEIGKKTYFNWMRLDANKPSFTIPAHWRSIFHWSEKRRLTAKELCIVSSFPIDYNFRSHSIAGYMMGMSVPPYMMAELADCIRDQWFAGGRQ